ncbi:MAG: cytochrome c [Wenzhouxiangellaceae bacterium]
MRNPTFRVSIVLALVLFFHVDTARSDDATRIEQGRALYQHGQRIDPAADPMVVEINGTAAPLPLFTCAQCHGERGEGQREGGIEAPSIRWSDLSKPYNVSTSQHRQRPPYTPRTLAEALRKGVDPAGQQLDPRMPRYRFSDTEIEALLAYLNVIDQDLPTGVDRDSIRIRIQLPGPPADHALDSLIQSWLDDVNHNGGIYQRRLLRADPPSDAPVFLVLDVRGPDAQAAPDDTHLPQHAIRISLFARHTGTHELALWPDKQQMRRSLSTLAKQRWSLSDADLPTWRNLEHARGAKPAFAILAHDAAPGLLEHLRGLDPAHAPHLLLEDWLGNPGQQAFSRDYAGETLAVVPVIPENRQRRLGQRYQALAASQALPETARAIQLWALFVLERSHQALRHSGRGLSVSRFMEQWENERNRDDSGVGLIRVDLD